jgi:hypothetical protein
MLTHGYRIEKKPPEIDIQNAKHEEDRNNEVEEQLPEKTINEQSYISREEIRHFVGMK